jgi:hypothetical protein
MSFNNRLEANREILRRLQAYLEADPDMRFSQALRNLRIVEEVDGSDAYYWEDDFYTESSEIVKRMDKKS